jgi:vancomycin resistance protein VanJ
LIRYRLLARRSSGRKAAVRWLLWACTGYGVIASGVLAGIAVLGDSRVWTYAAALASFWWLLPAPFLLLLVVMARGWWVVVVLLAPATVCAQMNGPCLVNLVGRAAADEAADLRVATFNLTNGRPLDGLVTLATQERPDILLLQEVTSSREEIASLLPEYPYASMGTGVSGPGHDGSAVLSRYPITDVRPVPDLPLGARPADLVTVQADGRELTVLSVHLASPCIGCTSVTANPAGDTADAGRVRVAEARRYAAVVAEAMSNGPVIIGGDLNSSPLNRPLGELTAVGLLDTHSEVGTGPGLTRGPGPGVARVDVVLVAGLIPLRVVEGARGHSTHSPVIADLAWPEREG